MACQSLYDVVPILLCPHFLLFSILLTCLNHSSFFCILNTSQDPCFCCSLPLEHPPPTPRYSHGSLPYLLQVFCSNVTFSDETFSDLFKTANSPSIFPDLSSVVISVATDTLYISVIHFVSLSPLEYKLH